MCPQTKYGFCLTWLIAFLQAPYQQLIHAHLTQIELKSQEAFHVHNTCTCFKVKGNYFQIRTSCSLKYRWENKHFLVKRNSFVIALLTINNIFAGTNHFSLPTLVGRLIETTSLGISSVLKSFDHLHHKWKTLPMGYTLI